MGKEKNQDVNKKKELKDPIKVFESGMNWFSLIAGLSVIKYIFVISLLSR